MLKKIVLIFSLLFLSSCGFSPIHNNLNDDITIKNLDFEKGDRDLNIFLKRNLSKYQNKDLKGKFDILISTNYEKIIISRDKKGSASKYQLKAKALFTIKFQNQLKTISMNQSFVLDHIDDNFESKKYEETIKRNFANTFVSELILNLTQIK